MGSDHVVVSVGIKIKNVKAQREKKKKRTGADIGISQPRPWHKGRKNPAYRHRIDGLLPSSDIRFYSILLFSHFARSFGALSEKEKKISDKLPVKRARSHTQQIEKARFVLTMVCIR
jgi:hypothetical protein